MNVKFPNNTSKWQIEFNSAFKGLMYMTHQTATPTGMRGGESRGEDRDIL
jgi:hypothetical protein